MPSAIHSPEAFRLNTLLLPGANRYGPRLELIVNNEEITVMVGNKRTYIYGDYRSAVVVASRKTIEGANHMSEDDVLFVLRQAKDVQEMM